MASKPILYYTEASPPSRSARYVAEQIGLDVELRDVNLGKKEQTGDAFKSVNPTQTVPAIDDGGFKLFESHAVMSYLVDKYAKNDTLYPKLITTRAKINAILYFETQFLFGRLRTAIESIFFGTATAVSADDLERLKNSLDRFEDLIAANNTPFLAGNQPTIADFSCVPAITSFDFFVTITPQNYPKIYQWKRNIFERIPGLEKSETNGYALINKMLSYKLQINQAMNCQCAMRPILYVWEVSPPCRSVQLLVKYLKLDVELKTVLLTEREQYNEEFLQKNPIHTIPLLEDDGNYFFESHAIMTYLVDKYADTDSLYSTELVARTKLNSLLHFDTGFLFPILRTTFNPVLYEGATEVSTQMQDKCHEILARLEALLPADKPYLMGDNITLAEFSIIPTLSAYEVIFPLTGDRYPKMYAWRKRVFETYSAFEVSESNSIKLFKKTVADKINENKKSVQ